MSRLISIAELVDMRCVDVNSPVTNEKLFHRMYTQMMGVVEQISVEKEI